MLPWCWHAGARGRVCREVLGCRAQHVPGVSHSMPDTAHVAFTTTLLYFLEICLATVPVALPSSFSFVAFPGVVRSLGDDPADPVTWQYGCCCTVSPSSLLQPKPIAALLLPSLLSHLKSTTMSQCLPSAVGETQWSHVGHFPGRVSTASLCRRQCCFRVSVPQKGNGAAEGPYQCKAL